MECCILKINYQRLLYMCIVERIQITQMNVLALNLTLELVGQIYKLYSSLKDNITQGLPT